MATGPSTSINPYLLAAEPNVRFTSILTVGDQVGLKADGVTPWRMVGIPDGLGAASPGANGTPVALASETTEPEPAKLTLRCQIRFPCAAK